MGLDMYLEREHYVKNWDHQPPERHTDVTVLRGGRPDPDIDTTCIVTIVEEAAYWRKANAVHAWFVKNCQGGTDDCRRAYVDREQLATLLVTVEEVLTDPGRLGPTHLPPQEGFFFGSYDYDEHYVYDLPRHGPHAPCGPRA